MTLHEVVRVNPLELQTKVIVRVAPGGHAGRGRTEVYLPVIGASLVIPPHKEKFAKEGKKVFSLQGAENVPGTANV